MHRELQLESQKRPLGREDSIKVDLREIILGVIGSINMSHERDQWRAFVNMVMNLPVP
jgi:hypothetical protein